MRCFMLKDWLKFQKTILGLILLAVVMVPSLALAQSVSSYSPNQLAALSISLQSLNDLLAKFIAIFYSPEQARAQTSNFSEDFETGNLNSWDSFRNLGTDGDMSVSAEDPHSGQYSLRINIDDTENLNIRKTSNPPFSGQREGTVIFYIKFAGGFTIPANNNFYLYPGGSCGSSLPGGLWIRSSLNGALQFQFTNQISTCNSQPITPYYDIITGAWYKISIYSKTADVGQSNGIIRAYVNDVLVGEKTTNDASDNTLKQIAIVTSSVDMGTNGTFYIDDFTVNVPSEVQDTTPPILSNGLPTGQLSAGTTQTTLSFSTDENATCKYATSANTAYSSMANTFSTTGGTSHSTTISGLSNGSSYIYYIRCQDTASTPNANSDDYSISFFVAAPAGDTIPPTQPTNLTATPISQSQINLTWSASTDNVGVTGYKIYRCQGTGCTPTTQLATAPSTSYQDTNLSSATTYTYTVSAYDAANNESSQSTSANATTQSTPSSDTTPPTVSITAPASNSTVSGNTTVTANASDNIGVAGVQFKLDGANLQTEDTASPYSITWDTTTVTNGSHALTATTRDAAGNTTTSSLVTVTVNNGPPPAGTVYYVDSTGGNDANPGTQLQPWRTIQKAANTVVAGDTVLIRGGVYNEKVTLSRSGQADKIITFKSYPGEKAIIDGTGITLSSSDGLVFFNANTSYVTLADLEVGNATADGIISLRPVSITIQNIDAHDNGGGIRFNCQDVNARSDSRIINSKSHHNQQEGIFVRNCPGGYFTIENNEIYNNVGTGNYDGIEIYNTPYVAVLNNTIRDNCGPSGPPCAGDSIDAGGTNALVSPSHHLIYEGNKVSGPADVAVKMNNEPLYSIIRKNVLTGTGFVFYEGPSKIAVYHNTVVNPGEAVQFWGNGDNVSGLNFGGTQVKNNLFVNAAGYIVNIGNQAVPDTSSIVFDSNLYKFLSGNPSGINVNGPNSYNRTFSPNAAGLASFNAALDQEPNGKVTTQNQSELFVDAAAKNYALLGGSAAIDAGKPLTIVVSQTNPTTFIVGNSWYFQDGWGGLLTPDTIRVGAQDVQIISVDYQTHAITADQSITAMPGMGVSFPYSSTAPGIAVID